MKLSQQHTGINPLQFMASPDGWFDFGSAPPLRERLAIVAAAGFVAVHGDVPSDLTVDQYLAELARAGLKPAPGYIALPWSEDPAQRLSAIDRARRTAADQVRIGNDAVFLAMELSETDPRFLRPAVGFMGSPSRLEGVRDYIGAAATAIAAEGILGALHPHIGSWVETEEEARFVLDTIPASVLKFGPDSGHLAWAGADPARLVGDYSDRISCLHIKDYHKAIAERSRTGALDYRATVRSGLWAEPGSGDADFAGLFDALGEDRDPWVVIEVDRGTLPSAADSIARCGQWLRSVVQ